MHKKISIIGAGRVGGTAAFLVALKNLGEIVLLDIDGDLARGRALDIMHCSSIENFQHSVVGTSSYENIAHSDVVVITAGFARFGEGSRAELLERNFEIVSYVSKQVVKHAPNAFVIMVTNPLDILTWVVKKVTGLPNHRIVGMAGILDGARMNYHSAIEAGTYPNQFSCMIVGNHGEYMTNVASEMNLNGFTAEQLIKDGKLTKEQINSAYLKTVKSGANICQMTKASTIYAPASAITSLVDAYLNDRKKIIPCSVYLDGQYGVSDLCIGVPVVIGRRGVEEIIQVKLSEEEQKMFNEGVQNTQKAVNSIKDRING